MLLVAMKINSRGSNSTVIGIDVVNMIGAAELKGEKGAINNNNRDLFYVIALVPHQLPGKVDPHRWQYQRNRDNAAARMRR